MVPPCPPPVSRSVIISECQIPPCRMLVSGSSLPPPVAEGRREDCLPLTAAASLELRLGLAEVEGGGMAEVEGGGLEDTSSSEPDSGRGSLLAFLEETVLPGLPGARFLEELPPSFEWPLSFE